MFDVYLYVHYGDMRHIVGLQDKDDAFHKAKHMAMLFPGTQYIVRYEDVIVASFLFRRDRKTNQVCCVWELYK